jgi:dihydrodipicolinate reductase
MIKMILSGAAGHMGHVVADCAAAADDFTIVAGLDQAAMTPAGISRSTRISTNAQKMPMSSSTSLIFPLFQRCWPLPKSAVCRW